MTNAAGWRERTVRRAGSRWAGRVRGGTTCKPSPGVWNCSCRNRRLVSRVAWYDWRFRRSLWLLQRTGFRRLKAKETREAGRPVRTLQHWMKVVRGSVVRPLTAGGKNQLHLMNFILPRVRVTYYTVYYMNTGSHTLLQIFHPKP